MLFHIIDDCFVVVRERGTFRQAKVYRRGTRVYAGVGAGFVCLMHQGGTSRPNMLWEDLTPTPEIKIDRGGIPTITAQFLQIESKQEIAA